LKYAILLIWSKLLVNELGAQAQDLPRSLLLLLVVSK